MGSVEDALAGGALPGPFDTICCYDVLEHLADPQAVLARCAVAAPGARLHISIPNARHFSLLFDLVVRGTFGYRDWGHRDSTHLRWYTRRDLVALVESAGWNVRGRSPDVTGATTATSIARRAARRASSTACSGTCSPAGPERPFLRALHLCHCYPPAVGGSETLMAELSRRLVAEHSHTVTVSTTTALSTA